MKNLDLEKQLEVAENWGINRASQSAITANHAKQALKIKQTSARVYTFQVKAKTSEHI